MRNEIMSEDIQKCKNILLFAFLILHSYNQWRNQRFQLGWPIGLLRREACFQSTGSTLWKHALTRSTHLSASGAMSIQWNI